MGKKHGMRKRKTKQWNLGIYDPSHLKTTLPEMIPRAPGLPPEKMVVVGLGGLYITF